jgi:hypothetical protein
LIGRHRGAQDQIDLVWIDARTLNRLARSLGSKLRSVFAGSGLVSLFDTGTGGNPFIRCLDDLFQIGVCQHNFRIRMAGAKNACVDLSHGAVWVAYHLKAV